MFNLVEEMMKPMGDASQFAAMFATPEKFQEAATDMMKANPFADFMPKMGEMPEFPAMDGLANLSVQPAGAVAAGSAVAMGVTSQMFGLMFGSTTGAMQAASKLAKSDFEMPAIPSTLPNPFTFEWAFGASETAAAPAKPKPTVKKAAAKPKAAKLAKPAPVKKVAEAPKPVAVAEPKPAEVDTKPVAAKPEQAPVAEPVDVAPAEPVATVLPPMPEDFVKPAAVDKPATPDDLKLISGVGPKLEKVLNGLGIWTFGQIAAWSQNEIAWVDDYLQFKGRIERDDWIAQAAKLAKA